MDMTKSVTLKTIEENDNVGMYSISFEEKDVSEFEEFINKFKEEGEYSKDFNTIIFAIKKIISQGAKERFFRPEGSMSDHVNALAIDSRKLRLYCLRISDKIVVFGNGGVKNTRTYQESEELNGYVIDLQKFDNALKEAQRKGRVSIEKNVITGIESQIFTL